MTTLHLIAGGGVVTVVRGDEVEGLRARVRELEALLIEEQQLRHAYGTELAELRARLGESEAARRGAP